jgi:hypothetical protein
MSEVYGLGLALLESLLLNLVPSAAGLEVSREKISTFRSRPCSVLLSCLGCCEYLPAVWSLQDQGYLVGMALGVVPALDDDSVYLATLARLALVDSLGLSSEMREVLQVLAGVG